MAKRESFVTSFEPIYDRDYLYILRPRRIVRSHLLKKIYIPGYPVLFGLRCRRSFFAEEDQYVSVVNGAGLTMDRHKFRYKREVHNRITFLAGNQKKFIQDSREIGLPVCEHLPTKQDLEETVFEGARQSPTFMP